MVEECDWRKREVAWRRWFERKDDDDELDSNWRMNSCGGLSMGFYFIGWGYSYDARVRNVIKLKLRGIQIKYLSLPLISV